MAGNKEEHHLGVYAAQLDTALQRVLDDAGSGRPYDMLRYFFGYTDVSGNKAALQAGKRIRPNLLLYIAELYGRSTAVEGSVMQAAVAVELFHNFTLIHDDIEDHDEVRRGRPTLWRVWGEEQAINAGDALAFLVGDVLLDLASQGVCGTHVAQYLNSHFRMVAEGQHDDLLLAALPLSDSAVTIERYREMIRKKSAVLIGAAAGAGSMIAGGEDVDVHACYKYGEALGMAYQVADDVQSLWGVEAETGKRRYGDLYERKKTFPVVSGVAAGVQEVVKYYEGDGTLSNEYAADLVAELAARGAYSTSVEECRAYCAQSRSAAMGLAVPTTAQHTLASLVDALVRIPEVGWRRR